MDEIIAWIWALDFWHWWAIGVVLIALEVFVASTFLLWPGLSAFAVGVIVLAQPALGWQYQVLIFAVLAVITSVAWQIWLRRHPTETDRPNLNVRGASFIGRRIKLPVPLENGRGRIQIGDGWWLVASADGGDLAAGIDVEVVGSDGSMLTVQPVSGGSG